MPVSKSPSQSICHCSLILWILTGDLALSAVENSVLYSDGRGGKGTNLVPRALQLLFCSAVSKLGWSPLFDTRIWLCSPPQLPTYRLPDAFSAIFPVLTMIERHNCSSALAYG